ncbi:MAG: ATP-binding protein [Acidobacteria bacterium]|nr:ATP-binding protein [Acidobacteriota bacterium]
MADCPTCGGTGFQIVDREGREFAQPCGCRKPSGASGDRLFAACRIPPRYEHCSLANFEPGTPSLRAALEKGLSYCAGFPYMGTDEGLGLLFTGDNGVGKTHLAMAVLRELVTTKGVSGQFWDFHELIREIKNSYNPETRTTELQVLEPVVETDVFVLDDLGAWKMTDWMNDTLFYILNSRYLAKRATLITTNFQDVDREAALAADQLRRKEFLVERIGQRLRSRLMEMCLVIPMNGPDWRQLRQSSNQVVVRGSRS